MTAPIGPVGPSYIGPIERGQGAPLVGGPEQVRPGERFSDLLTRGLRDTQKLQDESKDMMQAFLRGEPVELHQVMAAGEEAGIALELLVEMRNKLTEAYRSVMNTQI